MSSRPYAVILAGGGGTRLWPLSTPGRPKPFLPLLAGRSPIQATVERLLPLIPLEDLYVVVSADQVALVHDALPSLDPGHVIPEAVGRNTGPAVALAMRSIDRPGGAVMLVLPADHAVRDAAAWRTALGAAIAAAEGEPTALVTLGVIPTRPATGYGYIVAPDGRHVVRFTEKPDAATAAALIADGARWNAGIFAWRRDAIRAALERHAAPTLAALGSAATPPAVPIDRLVLEPAAAEGAVRTLPLDCGWSDIGTWSELREHLRADDPTVAEIRIAAPGGRTIVIDEAGVFALAADGTSLDLGAMGDDELRAAAKGEGR